MQLPNKSNRNNWIEKENCFGNDLIQLTKRIYSLSAEKSLSVENLGDIGGYPLLFLTPSKLNDGPKVLIAAGFHGDEPAGCWGIIHFLENAPTILGNTLNVSFLPLVNPTGFRLNKRTNTWDEDPNRGFYHTDSTAIKLSREGHILLSHFSKLKSLGKHGFLSLHEDVDLQQFYLYTFEATNAPTAFSEILRDEERKFFSVYPDGTLEGGILRDGIIFRQCDGSFEDLMFHQGIPRTACTETPGKIDINVRIAANSSLISAFVEFALHFNAK